MKKLEADLYFDGASKGNPGMAAVGVSILNTNQRTVIVEKSIYLGETTNNAAEYMGLIHGLQLAQQYGVTRINIYTDSMLVANHLKGIYKVRNSRLEPLYNRVIELLKLFGDGYEITHIPRSKNARADELANEAIKRGY
ncbi:MAG TPA: ribonuclease HI family protein [Candidatus Dojkabacteria bacterium]|nr:ribonuclease HI family protein [Candidatus Dojkabacteria bacterium]